MSLRVLITGAKGLIGEPLIKLLLSQGNSIHILSRTPANSNPAVKEFGWDIENGSIDERSLEGVDAIIHLAGENIGAKPWTTKRKHTIVSSRTKSLELLFRAIKGHTHAKVKTLISASAVGYYGDRGDEILTETSHPGTGFLADTCMQWEHAADALAALGHRGVKRRTGVVLAREGGALPKIAGPVKSGFGTILGSGKQWMPWVHLHDAAHAYVHALNNEQMEGAYNLSSPRPVTNKVFTETVAAIHRKKIWLPNVPDLALRIALGEMKAIVLSSNRTDSTKLQDTGFNFKYAFLPEALHDLYG
ncbi:TIGR01777 family oxidoreductase [Arcticibacter sp.]|uniref:TIGR01777 family oxidoreductase n=1 Tax=Arcticibacter sp. TaxID=1872630 RepID=UPI00388D7155